jgi:hypothetical protein
MGNQLDAHHLGLLVGLLSLIFSLFGHPYISE